MSFVYSQNQFLYPVIGFVAYSGTGKTTLIEKIIQELSRRSLAISAIKHTHHRFDVDRPGKDSYRHREAGAKEIMLVSDQRWVLMHELKDDREPTIHEQLAKLTPCDLVIVEGFKHMAIPKIELWRADHEESANNSCRANTDLNIQALACPGGVNATKKPILERDIRILDLDNHAEIGQYILDLTGLSAKLS